MKKRPFSFLDFVTYKAPVFMGLLLGAVFVYLWADSGSLFTALFGAPFIFILLLPAVFGVGVLLQAVAAIIDLATRRA